MKLNAWLSPYYRAVSLYYKKNEQEFPDLKA